MNDREHAVLSLFYDEGNREVTPSFLAYRMRISIRDATSLLDGMVKRDILDLHVDDDGHIVYRLPPAERERTEQYRRSAASAAGNSDAPRKNPRKNIRRNPAPSGQDATVGYAPSGRSASQQPLQGTRRHQASTDGTDGSVRGSAATAWTTADPQQHTTTTADPDPTAPYQDWYAAGDNGTYDQARQKPPKQFQRYGAMPERQELTPYQSAQYPAHPAHYRGSQERIPVLAGALSLLVPGLGQFYNGEVGKGVMLLFSCLFLWVFLLFWIVWIWSVIDAYMVAEQSNQRMLTDDGPPPPLLTDQHPHGPNPNSNAA